MKSFVCADFFVVLLVLLMITFGFSASELEQSKNRRGGGGSSGLFAFPRVGRGDPSLASSQRSSEAVFGGLDSNAYEEYEDSPKTDMKRASMIAFPRVGRRDDTEIRRWAQWLALQQALDKRAGRSANTGLWFGPRLGKRSVSSQVGPTQSPKSRDKTERH